MPIKITQQEIAEGILDMMVKDLKLKPGDAVPDQQLKERYRARKGDSADIKEGLKYAADEGWLAYELTTQMWHLTELGHENA
jgi:hypothetical protein